VPILHTSSQTNENQYQEVRIFFHFVSHFFFFFVFTFFFIQNMRKGGMLRLQILAL